MEGTNEEEVRRGSQRGRARGIVWFGHTKKCRREKKNPCADSSAGRCRRTGIPVEGRTHRRSLLSHGANGGKCSQTTRVGRDAIRSEPPETSPAFTAEDSRWRKGGQARGGVLWGRSLRTCAVDAAAVGGSTRRTGDCRLGLPRNRAAMSKKNELKPWRKSMWCIPPKQNAEFVYHMENVLEVYQRPYDPRFPLICMDELSKQLTRETQIPIPAAPGRVECFDYEYERNGTANVFVFTEPLAGWRHVAVTDRRTKTDWAVQVRDLLNIHRPDAQRITLVMDNLNTHSLGSLYEAFPPEEARRLIDRLEVVYTPKHGSWLNMAEIELNVLSRQCLARRIADKNKLRRETSAWQAERNNNQATIDWQFTAEDARIKLKRLYPKI